MARLLYRLAQTPQTGMSKKEGCSVNNGGGTKGFLSLGSKCRLPKRKTFANVGHRLWSRYHSMLRKRFGLLADDHKPQSPSGCFEPELTANSAFNRLQQNSCPLAFAGGRRSRLASREIRSINQPAQLPLPSAHIGNRRGFLCTRPAPEKRFH